MSMRWSEMEKGQMETTTKKSSARAADKTKRINFRVKASEGSEVYLVGSFNNWSKSANRMRHDSDGYYMTALLLPPGRYEYKFLVNGSWVNDPECRSSAPNSYGSVNSVVDVVAA